MQEAGFSFFASIFFFLQKKKKSEKSFGAELLGSLSDIGGMITGENRGGNQTGYIDASGNYHQRTCFVKGSMISTLEGQRTIESLKLGDKALSWNPETGKLEYRTITNLFERKTDLIYKLTFSSGRTVETTWNHPFWVSSTGTSTGSVSDISSLQAGKWIETKDLKVGDVLKTANSSPLFISAISTDARVETVYNFEVEGNHTYFVGEDGVLVHNQSNAYGAWNVGSMITNFVKDKLFGKDKNSQENDRSDSNKQNLKDAVLGATRRKVGEEGEDVEVSEDGTVKVKGVKYHSQRDNKGITGVLKPNHMCSPTSIASVMEFNGANISTGDDIINDPEGKKILGMKNGVEGYDNYKSFLKSKGMEANLLKEAKDGTVTQAIKDKINQGIPVVKSNDMNVGAVGGHITVITGYNDKKKVWIVNDPFGDARTGYKNKNGEGVEYDYGKYNIEKKYGYTIEKRKSK